MASRPQHATPMRLPEYLWPDCTFAMPAPLEPTLREVILGDAPYLYWPLGETGVNTAVDASGNGRHGLYVGAPETAGRALTPAAPTPFASDVAVSRAWIRGPHLAAVFSAATYECWVSVRGGKPPPTAPSAPRGAGMVLADETLTVHGGADYLGYRLSGNAGGSVYGLIDVFSGATPPDLHIVMTHDATTGALYLNNSLVEAAAHNGVFLANSVTLSAGGSVPGSFRILDGLLAHCAVYTGALSAERVAAHYRAGTTVPQRGVLGTTQLAYLGPPQQWVVHGEAAPHGRDPFTLVTVVQASVETAAGAQQAIVSTIDGSPVDKGGLYLRYTQNNVQLTLFNDVGSGLAAITVATSQAVRRSLIAVHQPNSSFAALYVDGTLVGSVANPVRWSRQGSMGIGVRHIGGTTLQQFSGTIEQVYFVNRALAAWEITQAHRGVITS